MRIHGEDLNTGKLLTDHGAKFAGLKVRKERIEEKNLTDDFVQTLKCLCAADCFRQIPAGLTQLLSQLQAKPAVRAHQQDADGVTFLHSNFRGWGRTHKSVNQGRLGQINQYMERPLAKYETGLLAADVRLDRGHAESYFRTR
jgi:hypothetical protein